MIAVQRRVKNDSFRMNSLAHRGACLFVRNGLSSIRMVVWCANCPIKVPANQEDQRLRTPDVMYSKVMMKCQNYQRNYNLCWILTKLWKKY